MQPYYYVPIPSSEPTNCYCPTFTHPHYANWINSNARYRINSCCQGDGSDLDDVILSSNTAPYQIDGTLDWDESILLFFSDMRERNYVLKQIKDPEPDEQFLLVLDSVGSLVAEDMDFPVNRVRIIPPSSDFPLKKDPSLPATLHTFVKGVRTDEDTTFYPRIDIQQRYRVPGTPMYKRYGPLPPEKAGLSRKVIKNMALHPDLATITALDTFLGNADRSKPNLFYCPECNRFIGIDQASIFRFPLAREALRQIKALRENNVRLSIPEIEALKAYRNALAMLYETYPFEKLEYYLDEEAKKGGFEEGSPLYTEEVTQRIQHHKRVARENTEIIPELLENLDRLFQETITRY